jgi:hypothetical protein
MNTHQHHITSHQHHTTTLTTAGRVGPHNGRHQASCRGLGRSCRCCCCLRLGANPLCLFGCDLLGPLSLPCLLLRLLLALQRRATVSRQRHEHAGEEGGRRWKAGLDRGKTSDVQTRRGQRAGELREVQVDIRSPPPALDFLENCAEETLASTTNPAPPRQHPTPPCHTHLGSATTND